MPDNRESKRGSGKKTTGASAGTPHPQQGPKEPAEQRPLTPYMGRMTTWPAPELLDEWRGLLREVRARFEAKQLAPEASAAMASFFDELEAQTEQRGLALAEHMHPAARRFLGGLVELMRDGLPALPNVHQLGDVAQLLLAEWLGELTEAIRSGDVSRLARFNVQAAEAAAAEITGGPGLEHEPGEALGLAYPLGWYVVKTGPGQGQRRPALIVAQDEETGRAELEVFFRLADRPHEPRAELVDVAQGNEPGAWHPILGQWAPLTEEPSETGEAEPLPT